METLFLKNVKLVIYNAQFVSEELPLTVQHVVLGISYKIVLLLALTNAQVNIIQVII